MVASGVGGVATWVDVFVALTTIGLAIAAFRQIRVSVETAKATKEQSAATFRAVHESIITRIDAQAPRLVVLLSRPCWPPIMPSEMADGEPGQIPGSPTWVTPRDDQQRMGFVAIGLLRNDGHTTTEVSLDGAAEFITTDELRPHEQGLLECTPVEHRPIRLRSDEFSRWALEPGQNALFRFGGFRPMSDWISAFEHRPQSSPTSGIYGDVISIDPYDNGTTDNVTIEIQAFPVEPVPEQSGAWRLAGTTPGTTPEIASAVAPVHRRYWESRSANLKLPTPGREPSSDATSP
jgi:hypothetical protein